MLLTGVRNWIGGGGVAGHPPPPPMDNETCGEPASRPVRRTPGFPLERAAGWPAERIALVESLWGEGFLFPGGEDETLRLARPLGLSAAASLLLVGAGTGGPPRAIAARLGVWVSGFEADIDCAALAMERSTRAGLGRRAQVEMWSPDRPAFRTGFYHHALALQPLRGAPAEPVLTAIAQAIKPGGQLAMIEMVAGPAAAQPGARDEGMLRRWAALEGRGPDLPQDTTITRSLGRLGFDVRVVEDVSDRHAQLTLCGWRNLVRALDADRPDPHRAAMLVTEAELWLLRTRLIRAGTLRLMRWHAVGRKAELG